MHDRVVAPRTHLDRVLQPVLQRGSPPGGGCAVSREGCWIQSRIVMAVRGRRQSLPRTKRCWQAHVPAARPVVIGAAAVALVAILLAIIIGWVTPDNLASVVVGVVIVAT